MDMGRRNQSSDCRADRGRPGHDAVLNGGSEQSVQRSELAAHTFYVTWRAYHETNYNLTDSWE